MVRSGVSQTDPDDLFAETRMSFGDHLEDLRVHLWRAVAGFLIAMILSFFVGRPVLTYIIIRPVEEQLQEYYDVQAKKRQKEVLADTSQGGNKEINKPKLVQMQFPRQQLKALAEGGKIQPLENPDELPDEDWVTLDGRIPEPIKFSAATRDAQTLLGPRPTMKTFNIAEAFMVYFKVCLVSGFVLGSPWIFYQIWAFVAAGLYPQEKRYVHFYLPFSLGLFLAGVLVCQFIVMPKAISALLWFNEWLNLEPDLRLNEWLGFAIWFPVFFGLSFQTPLVMLFLERLGIFTVETYRNKRKISFFILAIVAAGVPAFDMFSMVFQWVALCLLYQLGIWLCVWSPHKTDSDIDVPDPEEMVEV